MPSIQAHEHTHTLLKQIASFSLSIPNDNKKEEKDYHQHLHALSWLNDVRIVHNETPLSSTEILFVAAVATYTSLLFLGSTASLLWFTQATHITLC